MTLELSRIAAQVAGMVARLKAGSEQRQQHLQQALTTLSDEATSLERLKRKIASSKTSWLVAEPVDGLNQRHQAPPPPAEFTVIAADGSQIDVDRHRAARCYLINIGSVVLNYGTSPGATLDSFPPLSPAA